MTAFIIVALVLLIARRRIRRVLRGLLSLTILLAVGSRTGLIDLHLHGQVPPHPSYLQTRFDVFICPAGLTKQRGKRDDVVVCNRSDGYAEAYNLWNGERARDLIGQN